MIFAWMERSALPCAECAKKDNGKADQDCIHNKEFQRKKKKFIKRQICPKEDIRKKG